MIKPNNGFKQINVNQKLKILAKSSISINSSKLLEDLKNLNLTADEAETVFRGMDSNKEIESFACDSEINVNAACKLMNSLEEIKNKDGVNHLMSIIEKNISQKNTNFLLKFLTESLNACPINPIDTKTIILEIIKTKGPNFCLQALFFHTLNTENPKTFRTKSGLMEFLKVKGLDKDTKINSVVNSLFLKANKNNTCPTIENLLFQGNYDPELKEFFEIEIKAGDKGKSKTCTIINIRGLTHLLIIVVKPKNGKIEAKQEIEYQYQVDNHPSILGQEFDISTQRSIDYSPENFSVFIGNNKLKSLNSYLSQEKNVNEKKLVANRIISQLFDFIQAASKRNMQHGDLHKGNLMINDSNLDGHNLTIIDLGHRKHKDTVNNKFIDFYYLFGTAADRNFLRLVDRIKMKHFPDEKLLEYAGCDEEAMHKYRNFKINLNKALKSLEKNNNKYNYSDDFIDSYIAIIIDGLKNYTTELLNSNNNEELLKISTQTTGELDDKIGFNLIAKKARVRRVFAKTV